MPAKRKILIFKGDRPPERSTAHHIYKRLVAECPDEYYIENLADIAFVIRGSDVACVSMASSRDIATYDLLYIRGTGHPPIRHALALYAAHHKLTLLGEEAHYFQHATKLTQYVALALAGVPVPDTIFATRAWIVQAAARCGATYPAVVKAIDGSNGLDNMLIKCADKLDDLTFEYPVVQQYIPNDFDYRVIVAGGEVMLAYKRIRTDTANYKNNVAEGATREYVPRLSPEVRDMALRAAAITRRDLGGIDIIRDKHTGAHYVLEVNSNFGIRDMGDGISEKHIARLSEYLHKRASS